MPEAESKDKRDFRVVETGVEHDRQIVTDPATSLGVPWGFTTARLPGDPRK